MNKRTTSIVIGLILATVVVAGGFFLLQRRGGRAAGSVTDASCTGDVGSFTFTYTTSSCGKDSTIVYGQDMENLLYVNDSSQKSDEGIGNCTYTHEVLLLESGTYYVTVISPNGEKIGDKNTAEPWRCEVKGASQSAEPPDITATPTPELQTQEAPSGDNLSEAENLTDVMTWYAANSSASLLDCLQSSELAELRGLAHLCAAAYQQQNDSQ